MPIFSDLSAPMPKPDLSGIDRLLFLTATDYPPFNFIDNNNRLTGYHVDLVRALCEELGIVTKCQIQALPWEELESALASGQGEAVIAGWQINRRLRSAFAFTDIYLRLPARFVSRAGTGLSDITERTLTGKRIGVIDNTAHETMLRAYFPGTKPIVYTQAKWMRDDLAQGKLEAIFGDGVELSFWLSGRESAGCCRFIGGPYFSSAYLGEGLAIAVKHDRKDLAKGLSYALRETARKGRMAEIFQRYFPRSFY